MGALLPMEIDGLRVAVSADRVIEIVSERGWTPLAGASQRAPGVVVWRDRAIAAIDVGVLLGLDPHLAPGESRKRVAVLRVGDCTAAVLVDAVHDVQPHAPDGAAAETGPSDPGLHALDDALDDLLRELRR